MSSPGEPQPMPPDDALRVWRDRLRALAPFAAAIRDPAFDFGVWHDSERRPDGVYSMPWFDFGSDALSLLRACAGWITPGFDWPAWARTEEAQRLLHDSVAMAEATPDQISKFLTALVRSDRFSEGALAEAYDSGLLARLLDRVAQLAVESDDESVEGDAPALGESD